MFREYCRQGQFQPYRHHIQNTADQTVSSSKLTGTSTAIWRTAKPQKAACRAVPDATARHGVRRVFLPSISTSQRAQNAARIIQFGNVVNRDESDSGLFRHKLQPVPPSPRRTGVPHGTNCIEYLPLIVSIEVP